MPNARLHQVATAVEPEAPIVALPGVAASEQITPAELRLASRNHGMPLEALAYDRTPVGLHYLQIHYDIPAVDPAIWRLTVGGRVRRELSLSLDDLRARPAVTRFKTAVIQAKAQEGLTQEKILATFDGLKVALQNEQESFAASAAATKQREIADRQQKVQEVTDAIAQKQKEIAQLQQRLSEVTTELVGAQGKIQRAESQFAIAVQRRALEIDQEKAKYVSLLQG